MIDTKHADTIKEILGSKYAKKILDHLTEKRIVRPNGEKYKAMDVYQVMNSNRENPEMEAAIFDLVVETKEKRQQELAKRRAILE